MPKRLAEDGSDFRHGTPTGARRHWDLGEPACPDCRAARAEYDRRRKAAPAKALRNRLHAKAQGRALRALAKAHPEQYRALYLAEKQRALTEDQS